MCGYSFDVTRNAFAQSEPLLPKWREGFFTRLKEAVIFAVAILCYLLPGFGLVFVVILFAAAAGVPSSALSRVGSYAIGIPAGMYIAFIATLYPAVFIRFAIERKVVAAFSVGDVLAVIRKDSRQYVLLVLVDFAFTIVQFAVGRVLELALSVSDAQLLGRFPTIGIVVVTSLLGAALETYFAITWAHLAGQYARLGVGLEVTRPWSRA